MNSFYSSIALCGKQLLFIGQDYKLYSYNTETAKQNWVFYLGRKSNIPPFVAGNNIWVMSNETESVWLDTSGKEIKKLPFSVETRPVIKDSILYTTGIYDLGALIAYDMKKDTIIWERFLAHGCSREPYYFNDRIVANAEGNNWLEVNYKGALTNASCDTHEYRFPSELACAEKFVAFTHDNKKVNGRVAAKLFPDEDDRPSIFYNQQKTFILSGGKLSVLEKNLRVKFSKHLYELSHGIEEDNYGPASILSADDSNVWLLYNEKLIAFDHKKKRLGKITDLQEWNPHTAIMDGGRLWLVSKTDGLLYGIEP